MTMLENLQGTEQFKLSTRSYNILMREGVRTVDDLLAWTRGRLATLRNMQPANVEEIIALQEKLQQFVRRPTPTKGPTEGQTSYTIRIVMWEAWWKGHDAGCAHARDCKAHINPYDEAES